jgi:elongation factor Ts
MMDCKNALAEADGNFERATEIIRERGKLIASKRADRLQLKVLFWQR